MNAFSLFPAGEGGRGVAKLHLGALFGGGPGHVPSLPCPALNPTLTEAPASHNIAFNYVMMKKIINNYIKLVYWPMLLKYFVYSLHFTITFCLLTYIADHSWRLYFGSSEHVIYTIILLMDSVIHRTAPLWRLFVVFTDRVLGRSLCEMS